jgi:hypothetical protein
MDEIPADVFLEWIAFMVLENEMPDAGDQDDPKTQMLKRLIMMGK